MEFLHFGDIDAGGFNILEHLRKLTGVDFKHYKMDLKTLKQYHNYAKSLTENDKERLKRLKGSEFDEVIDYMLENNCKLEQEAIRFYINREKDITVYRMDFRDNACGYISAKNLQCKFFFALYIEYNT